MKFFLVLSLAVALTSAHHEARHADNPEDDVKSSVVSSVADVDDNVKVESNQQQQQTVVTTSNTGNLQAQTRHHTPTFYYTPVQSFGGVPSFRQDDEVAAQQVQQQQQQQVNHVNNVVPVFVPVDDPSVRFIGGGISANLGPFGGAIGAGALQGPHLFSAGANFGVNKYYEGYGSNPAAYQSLYNPSVSYVSSSPYYTTSPYTTYTTYGRTNTQPQVFQMVYPNYNNQQGLLNVPAPNNFYHQQFNNQARQNQFVYNPARQNQFVHHPARQQQFFHPNHNFVHQQQHQQVVQGRHVYPTVTAGPVYSFRK